MSAQYTPGLWRLRLGKGVQYDYIIETKNGEVVAAFAHYKCYTKKATKANARLMAASPFLLETLKVLVQFENDNAVSAADWFTAMDNARAAIAKATGSTE